ncbi:Lipopolysaccharide core heptosyltransferase RfaQ [Luteitalea pratensis]|uniref:Lipopolysaccharide core heptosyltransferase RfaQ n=1 Tax=Luteitalea pratensis TaxID=1855912 RepID=A0A143PU22_LUTPR|nr:glycosyltransferase family 9 protein [Luteitalea pratensis]AMY11668.1 Lipopolysaccharide core heptosyltransferase RfaQ [Luteitalea pratensis]
MRVLLVRLRLIGDVVFTTPIIGALRRAWPDAHLAYLIEPAAAPVVGHHPALNDVILAPRTRGWRRIRDDFRLGRRLRRDRYDLVLDLHSGPRASWLTWLSGAPRRVGFEVQGRHWAYTDVVARPREIRPRHSVENQWDILAPVLPGLEGPSPMRDPVTMVHAPEADASVDAWMRREGLSAADSLIVIHVSAGNAFRRWPLLSFVALADRLSVGEPNRRIILTSGPSEAAAAAEVVRLVRERRPSAPQAVRTCGDMSLDELHALVGRARLYIGGDSGPLHVAATTRTPIVGLYGPTLPVRSAPWRDPQLSSAAVDVGALPCRPCQQRVCVPGDFRCLTHITVDAVVAAAERALSLPASRTGAN